MENNQLVLNADHTDFLAEIFNMGMGQSLAALSNITGKKYEISFNVPKIKLLSREEFHSWSEQFQRMAIIVQRYTGTLEGNAFFYLPSSAGKELARLLIGTEISAEQVEKLESDAIIEIGNIFINSSINCLSNFLGIELETSIPEMIFQDRIKSWINDKNEVIHLNAQFSIDHLQLKGEVAFMIDNDTLKKLIELLNKF